MATKYKVATPGGNDYDYEASYLTLDDGILVLFDDEDRAVAIFQRGSWDRAEKVNDGD